VIIIFGHLSSNIITVQSHSQEKNISFQTTNYGLAGLCETHVDPGSYVNTNSIIPYESRFIRGRGDIIATIMAWLGDVQAGGGTGFQYPDGEMLVEPIRGSAAFWIDLRANGNLEKKSSHGGCPVLMGNKWILNKWIYAFDQWRNYPCDLIKHTDIPPWNGITK
jgi:prolyl 4-hydroxylase